MRNLALLIATGLSLSACTTAMNTGITSNSNSGSQAVSEFPVETALLNIYTKARTDTLIEANDNQNTVLEIKVVPKGKMTFNNQQLQGAETTYTIKSDGIIDQQLISVNYYTLNPTKFYGFTNSLGQYSVAEQTADMPKMAAIGESSQLITENIYSDSKQDVLVDSYTQTWSLSRASIDTAWFCIIALANPVSRDPHSENSECYLINAQGDLLKSKLTDTYLSEDGIEKIIYNSQ